MKERYEEFKYLLDDWLITELEWDKPFEDFEPIITVGDDITELDVIPSFTLKRNVNPTSKEIRLATDIVKEQYPLWRNAGREVLAEFVKDIFNYDVPVERIARVTPMKRVLFRRVVTVRNNKIVIRRVRKHVGLIASEKPISRLKRRSEKWLLKSTPNSSKG